MLIIIGGGALLAVALVALVIGLLAGSGGWLIASLVCTALAAALLLVQRRQARLSASGVDGLPVWVIDGEPDYHRPHCKRLGGEDAEAVPRAQAVADGFAACAQCHPVDG